MGSGTRGTRRIVAHPLYRIALVAIVYLIGARAGLAVAFSNRNVTAVWPPTGIAVAALLVWGLSVWPGVAIGALLANLANHAGIETSLAIMVGNTIAPVVAAHVLRRTEWFDASLEHMRDVLALFCVGGFSAMLISATLGTAALLVTGAANISTAGTVWLVWWVGDSIGVILFAPLLVLASRLKRDAPLIKRWYEGLLLISFAVAVTLTVFNVHIPLAYLLLVPVVWGAVSFEQLGAAVMTVLLAALAVAETIAGHGPFSFGNPTQNLVALQIFNSILAFAGLSLASVVHARRRAEEALRTSEEHYRRLLDKAADPVLVHDLEGKILFANRAASDATGFDVRTLTNMTIEQLVGPGQEAVVHRAVRRLLDVAESASYEVELRGPNGNLVSYDVAAVLMHADDAPSSVQIIARDVTSRKIAEGNLRRHALRDPGTGLPNRTLLAERIEYALVIAEQNGTGLALYALDIDDMGRINDSEGSGAGDALLRTIAHRLYTVVRPTDTVARLGGDEFALLLAPIDDADEAHAFALRIAAEVRSCSPLAPTVSIGFTMRSDERKSVETMLREADVAMQRAKRQGGSSVEQYRSDLDTSRDRFDEIRTRLERSLEQ